MTRFHHEASPAGPSLAGRAADDRLSYGGLTLWETSDGPVSLAGQTRPAAVTQWNWAGRDGPDHGTRCPDGTVMAAGSYSTVTGRWSEARRVRSVSVT